MATEYSKVVSIVKETKRLKKEHFLVDGKIASDEFQMKAFKGKHDSISKRKKQDLDKLVESRKKRLREIEKELAKMKTQFGKSLPKMSPNEKTKIYKMMKQPH